MIYDSRILFLSDPDNLGVLNLESIQKNDFLNSLNVFPKYIYTNRHYNKNTKFIQLANKKQIIIWNGSAWKVILFSDTELHNTIFIQSVIRKLYKNISIINNKIIVSHDLVYNSTITIGLTFMFIMLI